MLKKYSNILGDGHQRAWQAVSREISGKYIPGGLLRGDKIQAPYKHWVITLDYYTIKSAQHTRLRVPFVSTFDFQFSIQQGALSPIGKFIGLQDITIGDSKFDAAFVLKSNNIVLMRKFLDDDQLRRKITVLGRQQMNFRCKQNDGWSGGTLKFEEAELIDNPGRLKQLFVLLCISLDQLCAIGGAEEKKPAFFF